MTFEKRVALRIEGLCRERKLSVSALARKSHMSRSTIYEILRGDGKTKTRLSSIFKICSGFDITLYDFFSADIFNE